MENTNGMKWMLLGLCTGAAAAYLIHPESETRSSAGTATAGNRDFQRFKSLIENEAHLRDQEEDAELLKTATT